MDAFSLGSPTPATRRDDQSLRKIGVIAQHAFDDDMIETVAVLWALAVIDKEGSGTTAISARNSVFMAWA